MTCSIASLLLCLDLSGVYLDGSLSMLDSGVESYGRETTQTLVERDGLIESGEVTRLGYSHAADNPYGRVAIGYEQPFFVPQLRLSAELYHESSLAAGRDRGVNGARIGLRWFPWGGAR